VTEVYLIRKADRSFARSVRYDSMSMCETWAETDIQYAKLVPRQQQSKNIVRIMHSSLKNSEQRETRANVSDDETKL
jgi:hypothetical protein